MSWSKEASSSSWIAAAVVANAKKLKKDRIPMVIFEFGSPFPLVRAACLPTRAVVCLCAEDEYGIGSVDYVLRLSLELRSQVRSTSTAKW